MEDEFDVNLKVKIKPIYEEFCCAICFEVIKECYMTPCGHNFCKDCIYECLNRKHSCPCCNSTCVKGDLIRNHHFEKIIKMIEDMKDKAAKNHFNKLIKKPDLPNSLTESQKEAILNNNQELSPIEELFQKHMTRSLAAYDEYYRELKEKFDEQIENIREDFSTKMTKKINRYERQKRKIEKGNNDQKALKELKTKHDKTISKLQSKCESTNQEMQKSFDESISLLLDSYDKYLSSITPTPAYLPVTISVYIEEKDITIKSVVIKTTDSLVEFKEIITERLIALENPLHKWGENTVFCIKKNIKGSPGSSSMDIDQGNKNNNNNNNNNDENDQDNEREEDVIEDPNLPLVQYSLENNDIIIIKGPIELESDKPKMCFTATFKAGDTMDYFTCKDCKFNWICKECSTSCHAGHNVCLYIKNHKPTWNCCYCVKKKKCKIINKKKRTTG